MRRKNVSFFRWLRLGLALGIFGAKVGSIYVPGEDVAAAKPATSKMGIKTLSWQNPDLPEMHHNYSKVNVQSAYAPRPNQGGDLEPQASQNANSAATPRPHYPRRLGESESELGLVGFQQNGRRDPSPFQPSGSRKAVVFESPGRNVHTDQFETLPRDVQSQPFRQNGRPNLPEPSGRGRDYQASRHFADYDASLEPSHGRPTNLGQNAGTAKGFPSARPVADPNPGQRDVANKTPFDRTRAVTYFPQAGGGGVENSPSLYHTECPRGETGQFAYRYSCNRYLNCWKGRGHLQNCAPGTLFNAATGECDHAEKVECAGGALGLGQRREARPGAYARALDERGPSDNFEGDGYERVPDEGVNCGKMVGLYSHPSDCAKYFNCTGDGGDFVARCLGGLRYDKVSKKCSGSEATGGCIVPRPENSVSNNRQGHGYHSDHGYGGDNLRENRQGHGYHSDHGHGGDNLRDNRQGHRYHSDHGYGDDNLRDNRQGHGYHSDHSHGSDNLRDNRQGHGYHSDHGYGGDNLKDNRQGYDANNPKCPIAASGLFQHPSDCSKFLNCANGMTYVQDCAPGTLFNPLAKICDFPHNVDCALGRNPTPATYPNPTPVSVVHRDPEPTRPPYGGRTQNTRYTSQGGRDFRLETEESRWPPPFPSRNEATVPYDADYDEAATEPTSQGCQGNQGFSCEMGGGCVPRHAVCDGTRDCPDGSDEEGCGANLLRAFALAKNSKLAVKERQRARNQTVTSCARLCAQCEDFTCRSFNYRRHDGLCHLTDSNVGLSGMLIAYHPFDYYEYKPHAINCTGDNFTCPSGKCLGRNRTCNGIDDCGDRSDEKNCAAEALGYAMRLAGGADDNEGRLEVTAFGRTGYVCDDLFGMKDAAVACRELGYELGAVEVKGHSHYARDLALANDSAAFFMMDDVACAGNETSLRDCDFAGWGVSNCLGQEVVGVVCKTPEVEQCPGDYWQCDSGRECLPLAFLCDGVFDCSDASDESGHHCEAPTELRLSNGSSAADGRLEIKYRGTWGTVCDDDFNEDAAKVVCASLGFKGGALVVKEGRYGPGEGPIWLDQVYCQGNESRIEECVHWNWGEHNCEHSEDVGVVCEASASERSSVAAKASRKGQGAAPLGAGHQGQGQGRGVDQGPRRRREACGLRKDQQFGLEDDVHFRVVRGSVARKGDYPWQASIRVKGKSKAAHWCGAIVISPNFVLTAAHCLMGFAKGAYIVVAGDYDVDVTEGTEQRAYIDDFYVHEGFRREQRMNNDIALVKLKGEGFALDQDVQAICLPKHDAPYADYANCTISGFGSVQSGKSAFSHELRAGWVPIQPPDVCRSPDVYGGAITEGMFCAGALDEGVDACDGDSGGPLACLQGGAFTLFGITSWGQHCGHANKPGVYVKVAHYRRWIEEQMALHS